LRLPRPRSRRVRCANRSSGSSRYLRASTTAHARCDRARFHPFARLSMSCSPSAWPRRAFSLPCPICRIRCGTRRTQTLRCTGCCDHGPAHALHAARRLDRGVGRRACCTARNRPRAAASSVDRARPSRRFRAIQGRCAQPTRARHGAACTERHATSPAARGGSSPGC
jgi:hypothetical protein